MKCLLIFRYAKDLPQIYQSIEELKGIDKLIIKNYNNPYPVKIIQHMVDMGEFDEYDYIIMASTDLLVKQENLDILLRDIEETGYRVIGGICNVDRFKRKDELAACMKTIDFGLRDYEWIERGEYTGIKRVKHNGMVMLAIHKDIFKSFKFYRPGKYVSLDIRFSKWCDDNNIGIYTNFDNEMLHFHKEGKLTAGLVKPELIFRGKPLYYPS